jgi:predicted phage tail protein
VIQAIHGAGGGGKSKKQRTPVEAPNTLRSKTQGRILDLIAHGPIVGLVNGLQSIELDDTPLQNADGSFNFSGVTVHTREGYPDQDYVPGFPAVENSIEINTEVKYDTPVVRRVSNDEADAVVVTVQLSALSKSSASSGDMNGYSVPVAIDVQAAGGAWRTAVSDTVIGKTTSPYQRSYRVPLDGNGPFDIRVRRTSKESTSQYIRDQLSWATMVEVVDAKLSYPDSALVGIEVDASLFGSQLPSRTYDVKLSIISVPSNYDPETRKYTGIWDGSFKQAWTDNPAWVFYDLATHPVIGANVKNVDKWALYAIGKYCDELVPDGYGGMEPRFTVNTIFNTREEANTVLSNLASVFRGMSYWGSDSIVPVADMPADPVKLVTPANAVDGDFEYSGTSLRERHSVAIVMWNDPDDNYKLKPEFVEDPDSIELFGWRETQVTALGCTSRGQARRLGGWILYSERMETQTLTYRASADHADLRPGEFIQVADPDLAGARMGGRVTIPGTSELTLDKVPEQVSSDTWFLSVVLPSGSIECKQVKSFAGDQVTLLEPLSVAPLAGAVWVLASLSVTLPLYRVVSVDEDPDEPVYTVTATEHDPNKYSKVELGLQIPETQNSYLPSGPVASPMDITAVANKYLAGGVEHQRITIGWTPSKDVRVTEYILEAMGPTDVSFRTLYVGAGTSFDESDAGAGQWMFRLKAVTSTGRSSPWVSRTIQISNLLLPTPPDSVDVSVATFSIALYPRSAYPGATFEFWRSPVALTYDLIESNAVRLSVSSDLVDAGLRSGTQYFYYIRGANAYGLSTWYPVQATTAEDFDDILDAVDTDIRKPGGLFEQMIDEAKTAVGEGVAEEAAALVRADIDAAMAELSLLDDRVDDLGAGVHSLELMNELETVRYLATVAMHEGNSARASTEEATRADEDSSLAAQITTLQAIFDNNQATVTESLTALADADQAISNRVDTLQAQVGDDIQAQIQAEATARADADSALSQQITALSASTGDQFASLSTTYSTKAYTDGAVARAVTTATVNGKKAVFGISVDGVVSEIGAIADRFYVYNPAGGTYTLAFAVVNGQTVIQDALIRDGSINTAKIADAAITMAKISSAIQSDNYVEGMSGWRLTRAGEFEINGSVAGQGRVKITNQLVEVFDSNGTRRVRLGIWA